VPVKALRAVRALKAVRMFKALRMLKALRTLKAARVPLPQGQATHGDVSVVAVAVRRVLRASKAAPARHPINRQLNQHPARTRISQR